MKSEDKEKAKEIAEESQILSDFPHDYHSVEYGAMKMAEWKEQQYERDRYKPKHCKSCAYIGTFGCSYAEVNEDDLAPYHCYVEKKKYGKKDNDNKGN